MASDERHLPLGIPAVVKQQKILMCMINPVKLADHSFTYAPGHKLRPSVDALCEIVPGFPGQKDSVSIRVPRSSTSGQLCIIKVRLPSISRIRKGCSMSALKKLNDFYLWKTAPKS